MNARTSPTPATLEHASREELERLCIENLLTSAERVFFKDLEGRYIMVSAGWLAAEGGGRALDEIIGRTDAEIFSREYSSAARVDEQRVMSTGTAVIGKLERQTFAERPPTWVSTSLLPLRHHDGRVIGTFGTTRDVTADVESQDALAHRVLHDPLTGLPNRVALMDRIPQALRALERRAGWVGLLFIDLDGFKLINDTFGHELGDAALAEASERLRRAARRVDTVARFGGDEFVVLFEELRSESCLAAVAQRFVDALSAPLNGPAAALPFSASAGAAVTVDHRLEPTALLHRADLAMYAAKRAGGNRYVIYNHRRHRRPGTSRRRPPLEPRPATAATLTPSSAA